MGSLDTTGCTLSLNFIQVCQNYFRSHAWLRQSMLKYMYETATGCYVFPQCPAIDIAFPIKQVRDGKVAYHPCLVSAKCWDSIEPGELKCAQTSMRAYLQDRAKDRRTDDDDDQGAPALCLLLVIGTSSSPMTAPQSEGTFPHEDAYISIVCHRVISLESTRPFKLWPVRPTSRNC